MAGNNYLYRRAKAGLAEVGSDLKLLANGLEEVGRAEDAEYIGALSAAVSSIQSELLDRLGHGKLPEKDGDVRSSSRLGN